MKKQILFIILFAIILSSCAKENTLTIMLSYDSNIEPSVIRLFDNKKQLEQDIIQSLKRYLPSKIEIRDTFKIKLIQESNYGSHVIKDSIFIDVSDLDEIEYPNLLHILSHEIHHIKYAKWILTSSGLNTENTNCHTLFWWQFRIIQEGIAQQYTFNEYPQVIKDLYRNKSLLKELIVFWTENQLRILKSEEPQEEYHKIQDYMWSEWSCEKLKEYLSEPKYTELMPNRPTVEYYLAYHFYNTILENNDYNKMKYVIENPRELLRVYNESLDENSNLKISEKIMLLWENNFSK